MSWPLAVSRIINSSPKLIEQGIGSYGNGVFSGVGSDANNLKSTMNYNSGAGDIVNGTVGSIESFSGIGSGLSLLKTKSHTVTSMGSPKTVPTNPSIVTSSENPVGFLSYKIFGIPVYIIIVISIIALIIGLMVLK